jgi:hypothetical protein
MGALLLYGAMRTPDSPPPPAPKRPYAPPTLTRLGTVQELTRTSGTVLATEPIFNQTPKTSP